MYVHTETCEERFDNLKLELQEAIPPIEEISIIICAEIPLRKVAHERLTINMGCRLR